MIMAKHHIFQKKIIISNNIPSQPQKQHYLNLNYVDLTIPQENLSVIMFPNS